MESAFVDRRLTNPDKISEIGVRWQRGRFSTRIGMNLATAGLRHSRGPRFMEGDVPAVVEIEVVLKFI